MNQYEHTIDLLQSLSIQSLLDFSKEAEDELLAVKIKHLVSALQEEGSLETAQMSYKKLISYLKHALSDSAFDNHAEEEQEIDWIDEMNFSSFPDEDET